MTISRLAACAWVVALALASAPAHAEPDPGVGQRPWAVGVSQARQELALQLYAEGNSEFVQSRFVQALTKYRKAIEQWDHPAIRFNMAVCLVNLDRLVEARDNLERGLVYGPAPLGEEAHRQALTYRRLLDVQLTKLTITCEEAGAKVTLDGKYLFTGPGMAVRYLLPGDHQVVAAKTGFLTSSERISLSRGQPVAHDVQLVAFEPTAPMTRRMPAWAPFPVFTVGAVAVGYGIYLYLPAAGYLAKYESRCPGGAHDPPSTTTAECIQKRELARNARSVAISVIGVGGAVLVTGGFMLYLNRPRPQRTAPRPHLALTSTAGGAVLTLAGGF